VNSHVPHDVPARQPYAPAAPPARKNSGITCTTHVVGASAGSSPSRLPMRNPLVSMVASKQRAVSKHHDHQCGESGHVNGAIPVRRSVGGDLACIGHGLGERHTFSMPGREPRPNE